MRSRVFTTIGVVCLALAFILSIYNLYDDSLTVNNQNKIISEYDDKVVLDSLVDVPDYVLNPNIDMPEVDVDGVACIGVLEVFSVDLRLPVLSECTIESLKKAPGRFSGSIYLNNMVIGGHNSRAQFNSLYKLKEGDPVRFTDVVGNVFEYRVRASEVIGPDDVKGLTNGWPLSLFMCTYDNLNRYVIRCE